MRVRILSCLLAALALFLLAGCFEKDERLLDPVAARKLIEQNSGNEAFLILDVRTPGEFRQGYIEGAVLMNFYDADFRDRFAALDRSATILVYCHSGSRSSSVLSLADSLGFKRVYDMGGGIAAWKRAGLPIKQWGMDQGALSGPVLGWPVMTTAG
jgi:rhodanese-related sulfurtransferase